MQIRQIRVIISIIVVKKAGYFVKLTMLRQLSQRFSPPTNPEQIRAVRELLLEEGIDLLNFYQELEMSNPMVETHQDESYVNTVLSLHSHDFYEMLYCRSCEGVEYMVGAERYRLQPGDIVIVSPGVSHRPLLPEAMAVPYTRDIVWFSREFVELLPQMIPNKQIYLPRSDMVFLRTAGTQWGFIGGLFRYGVREAERGEPECDGIVLGNTITILAHISRALGVVNVSQPRAEKPELLDRVMAYIEKNLSEKITLEETARHFYVSASTVSQLFRQKMGTSFYRCVTQRRLIAAKTLIGQGENLETVSRAVGFSDYSSFYRAFKKEYGITPRQFTRL